MTAIQIKTVYVVFGKEFDSPQKAMGAVEDKIATHLRQALRGGTVGPRDFIVAMEYILAHRKELVDLLSVGLPTEEED